MPSKSKAQQRFFGMVRARQKGELKDPSPAVQRAAKSTGRDSAKHFAETSHEGLPDRAAGSSEKASQAHVFDHFQGFPFQTRMLNMSQLQRTEAIKLAVVYVRELSERVPAGEKAAAAQRNAQVCKKLAHLAERIERRQNLIAAIQDVYHDKSAAYQHRVADGLVKGLRKKLAEQRKAAMRLGATSHPSGSMSGGTSMVPGGIKHTAPQTQTQTMIA